MSRILQSFRIVCAPKPFVLPISVVNTRLFSSSSDDEKPSKIVAQPSKSSKPESSKQNPEAISKLNMLLQQIVEADQQNKKTLDLAKPKGRNAKTEPGTKSAKVETVEQKIVSAVKDVAETLGGNKKQTESELLNRLISNDEQLPSANLSDIVRGMKIDRESKSETVGSKAQHVRKILETSPNQSAPHQRNARGPRPTIKPMIDAATAEPVDIFGAEPLGIFNLENKGSVQRMNVTWDKLYERELKLAVTHPPQNYFEEQILWTEQGKIWKFPIDNEQGMEKEQSVYFTEHVFLEEHLSPWCPAKGPLRHFMELVCVGLSKNPYMSVEDKKEHIKWFENYFEEKKKLLQETGALPVETTAKKQLENK